MSADEDGALMKMTSHKFNLRVIENGEAAYLYLPTHPGEGTFGVAVKQIGLNTLIKGYKGPDIYLDFDKAGTLIGVEFLLDGND